MKSVTVCRLGHNATSQDVAIVFEVIAEINKVHKTGFNSIGQTLYYDFRQQPQSMFIAYDQKTMWKFKRLCKERGVSDALIEEYIHQPRDRHAVEVQESGKIVVHWHPKDVFIEVEPEDLNTYVITDGISKTTGIYPKKVFFVGPNREIIKAHRRYCHQAKHRASFKQGLSATDLTKICRDIPFGGAMYVVNHIGLVAKVTPSNFTWLTLEPHVGHEELRSRAAHGYENHTVAVGRKWDEYRPYAERKPSREGSMICSLNLAAATQQAYANL